MSKIGLSRRAYARLRGCSEMAVRKAIASGRIRPLPSGLLNPVECDRLWIENSDPARVKQAKLGLPPPSVAQPGRIPPFATSRARREYYEAKLARLEALEASGRLISRDQVERDLFLVLRTLRDGLLSVPDRIDAILAAATAASECNGIVRAEVVTALEEVTERLGKLGGRQTGSRRG